MKSYMLDTNVLLHDPNSIFRFQDNNVLIPLAVLEELDRFKRDSTELGRNARTVSRSLDSLRAQGRLSSGVQLQNGGQLRVVFPSEHEPVNGNGSVDNRIIRLALSIRFKEPNTPLILVTKDINLRIIADVHSLNAEDYESDCVQRGDSYSGLFEKSIDTQALAKVWSEGEFILANDERHYPNEYCTLSEKGSPKKAILTRVDSSGSKLVPIIDVSREGVWGIKPRNREQHFAFDALLRGEVNLVTLEGKAGTGKTLLAMASGLKRTVADREFRRMVAARPAVSVGKELGFFFFTLQEKLDPWMQPIYDQLELLGDLNMGNDGHRTKDLVRSGVVVVEALSYIRGRTVAGQWMIIDEAQNLTPLEVKTIVTRVGMGTKIVFTGDPQQIDNPYVDSLSNGFTYLVNRFRGQETFAHVRLNKGERSPLAEIAANLL